MQRRAALAVARNVYDARRAGYVECRPVAEGGYLEDRRRPKHALCQRQTEEAEPREADAEHLLVLRFGFAPRDHRVELVHAHPDASFAPETFGETDVVDVGMREHERPYVSKGQLHGRKLVRQIVTVDRHARVDDRDLAALLEQVRVDKAVADAMDPGADPHRGLGAAAGRRFGSAVATTVS